MPHSSMESFSIGKNEIAQNDFIMDDVEVGKIKYIQFFSHFTSILNFRKFEIQLAFVLIILMSYQILQDL